MKTLAVILMAVLCIAGCAVVNVYVTFPEEKIKEAAEDLLAPPPDSGPLSRISGMLFAKAAYAQDRIEVRREIITDSPGIRSAKQNMDKWRSELDALKRDGYIGETNDFAVVIRTIPDDEALARQVRTIVRDENRERKAMMDELIRINNVPSGEVAKFKRIFAEVMHRYSPRGTWIQTEEWSRK